MASKVVFQPKASPAKQGLVMVFDLEGFSRFFNQPDVHEYVTKYLNHVLSAVTVNFAGGNGYWDESCSDYSPLGLLPSHVKFLGDGALYIWTTQEGEDLPADFVWELVSRISHFENCFSNVVKEWADDLPVVDIPKRIRISLSRGTIYELQHQGTADTECIGFCINLASRLQNYCPELGFIASARLNVPGKILDEYGFIKVVAKKLRGFAREIVFVNQWQFEKLPAGTRSELFDVLD